VPYGATRGEKRPPSGVVPKHGSTAGGRSSEKGEAAPPGSRATASAMLGGEKGHTRLESPVFKAWPPAKFTKRTRPIGVEHRKLVTKKKRDETQKTEIIFFCVESLVWRRTAASGGARYGEKRETKIEKVSELNPL